MSHDSPMWKPKRSKTTKSEQERLSLNIKTWSRSNAAKSEIQDATAQIQRDDEHYKEKRQQFKSSTFIIIVIH